MEKAFLALFGEPSLQKIMSESIDNSQSSVFGAFGAVLGYIGAEAATIVSFERLLWPQRFFAHFALASLPRLALLLPMGGPLHKAALKTLDVAFSHGLFRGSRQGHMLGTAFFRPLDWTYTMHGDGDLDSHSDALRNCLWARTLASIPIPELDDGSDCGSAEKGQVARPRVRARVAVSHLTLSKATADDKASGLPFVRESAGPPGIRVLVTIICTELSGLVVFVGLAVVYKTPWALLWLAPLALHLLSAVCALQREPLISLSSAAADDPAFDFEVHSPQSDGNFILITGPPAIVLQFVRHYGHPVRSRWREGMQLTIIAVFGSLFPLSLLCSMIWMPTPVQFVWLCYQIFVVLAMYVARFARSGRGVTTEDWLAECLSPEKNRGAGDKGKPTGTVALFGHERHGAGTIKASLAVTYHSRYIDGKECTIKLLQRPKCHIDNPSPKGPQMMSRSTTGLLGSST